MSSSREYRSSLREEQALRTREMIRSAARELFSEKGFAATTINDIAEQAGVAAPTVYAVYESKAGIVSAMLDELENSVDMGPRIEEMLAERDPHRQLRLWANAHCALFEGGADVLRAAMQAIDTPEVRGLAERGDHRRWGALSAIVPGWVAAGAIREDLSERDVVERIWLMSTVQNYLAAVDELGWSSEKYEAWLVEEVTALVFA